MTSPSKSYDVTVFGATGFVGKLCIQHLLEHPQYTAEREFTWAIAGRSATKLASLKKEFNLPQDVGILEADTSDPTRRGQLEDMVKKSRVIINLVGPYGEYGSFRLAELCVRHGTHYTDLSGESAYNAELVTQLHDAAKESGSVLAASVGFDSLPFDLVVYLGVEQVLKTAAQQGLTIGHLEAHTGSLMKGGASGGTVASLRYMAGGSDTWQLAPRRPLAMGSPLLRKSPKALLPKSRLHIRAAQWLPQFKSYGFPSPFAMHNCRTVYHTAALLEAEDDSPIKYSPTFQMIDTLVAPPSLPWPLAFALCQIVASVMAAFGLLVFRAWFRRLLAKFMPVGSGPSEKSMKGGFVDLRALVVGWPSAEAARSSRSGHSGTKPLGAALASWKSYKADPGYLMTSRVICETALLILFDRKSSSKIPGGVRTGATLDNPTLMDRLQKYAKVRIGVEEWRGEMSKSLL